MKKLLMNYIIPAPCVERFSKEYEITMPSPEKGIFSKQEVIHLLPEFDGYFNVRGICGAKIFDAGTNLKVVANLGVGYDNVDIGAATERGLPIINTPTTVTEATAEVAIGLIICTMRNFTSLNRTLMATRKAQMMPFHEGAVSLRGKTLGIVGFGRIGQSVAQKAKALGMKIVYYKPTRAAREVEEKTDAVYLPFEELLKVSDCVSLNLPYFPQTYHMMGEKEFGLMKKSAYLVNTARGPIVDEAALVQALKQGEIAGAGLDVYENEPKVSDELYHMNNVTLLPHIGTLALDVRTEMAMEALEGMDAVLRGEIPYNVVNRSVLEK